MKNYLMSYSRIYYHRFEIRMIAAGDVVFDAWTGAVVRNNLLYAAEGVVLENQGMTLRERIDAFPLNETHPLYKDLKEGFPKGYVLADFSHSDLHSSSVSIKKNEIFSFSLILIGNFSEYKSYFFQAIRLMCERGLGKPQTPFLLLDISEQSLSGESQIMAVAQVDLSEQLRYPVRLVDFVPDDEPDEFSEITVRYITPVILFRLKKNKKNTQLSYQDKCNRFPSFYQLVRSALFRLQKLYAVYMRDEEYNPALFDSKLTDTYPEKAGHLLLQSTNMQYVALQNTQKKGKINDMPLAGYVGEQVYSGCFREYAALLRFMAEVGVGNETVYGMGRYEVEEEENSRKKRHHLKKISTLIIRFKNDINPSTISTFRKEITKLLANKYNMRASKSRHYSYPLIQFKRLNGKASIVCIEEGTESIGEFFANIRQSIHLGDKELSLELDTVNAYKILVQAWNSTFTYSIRKWNPFNKINHEKFQQIDDIEAKTTFLEELLIDNILSFAKWTGARFEQELTCSIIDIKITESNKNVTFASFDLLFKTNVSLPNYIGLGKGVSIGFGTVVRMNNNETKI